MSSRPRTARISRRDCWREGVRMTPASRLLLGVDGGNTKALALLAREDGTIVGTGGARRGSDIHAVPVDTVLDVLGGVVDAALADAAAFEDAVVAMSAFSLAGADWPEDVALLRRRLGARLARRGR